MVAVASVYMYVCVCVSSATPGRLNDLLMNGILTVNTVTYLVSYYSTLYKICITSICT